MTAQTGSKPRSLVVVSAEHGELGLATTFLRGQEFARDALMLLPDSLYPDDEHALPVAGSRYATAEDILCAADAQKPDLVFFFSGYMMAHERLMSKRAFDELVCELRSRGCQIVTSDPFLGLAARVSITDLDVWMVLPRKPQWRRLLTGLLLRLKPGDAKILRVPSIERAPHLYPTSAPATDDADGVLRLSFFDSSTLRPPTTTDLGPPESDADQPRPRWLFVLSAYDIECQSRLIGFVKFARIVARLLQQAQHAGRHPVLIGPPEILEVMSQHPGEIELVSLCSYPDFEAQLLSAEYAFYWNTFSFGMLARLANQLPVFAFDRGRLARTIKPSYYVGLTRHFGGWAPPILDQTSRLEPHMLEQLAERQELPVRLLSERWQGSATPDDVVQRLMQGERASAN